MLEIAQAVPIGIPGWLWPLAVAGGGSIILAVIGGVWALIRYAVPRWVRETAKPSERPTPTPAVVVSPGSQAVFRDLGAHGATLDALADGQSRIEKAISDLREALGDLRRDITATCTLHHGRLAVVESLTGVTPLHVVSKPAQAAVPAPSANPRPSKVTG